MAAWRWGKAHPALSVHRPFGNVAAREAHGYGTSTAWCAHCAGFICSGR